MAQAPPPLPEEGADNRFQLELEFVQCMANPAYLQYLAQQRYFQNPAFVNYLAYLQYWKRPEYAKYLLYPHCLYFLDALQDAQFRSRAAHKETLLQIHGQQYFHWLHNGQLPKPVSASSPANALTPSIKRELE